MLGFLRKPLGAREVSIFELSNQWPRWSTASTVGFLLSWKQTWLLTPFHFFTSEYVLATLLAIVYCKPKLCCCWKALVSTFVATKSTIPLSKGYFVDSSHTWDAESKLFCVCVGFAEQRALVLTLGVVVSVGNRGGRSRCPTLGT